MPEPRKYIVVIPFLKIASHRVVSACDRAEAVLTALREAYYARWFKDESLSADDLHYRDGNEAKDSEYSLDFDVARRHWGEYKRMDSPRDRDAWLAANFVGTVAAFGPIAD